MSLADKGLLLSELQGSLRNAEKYWELHALRFGKWEIRVGNGEVRYGKEKVAQLSLTEEETLVIIARAYPRILSRLMLMKEVRKGESYGHADTAKIVIGRIRRRLGCQLIETVYGRGYVLNPEAVPQ